MEHEKFNYALSMGVKLPTGKYDYSDTFYNQGSERDQKREAVVELDWQSMCKAFMPSPNVFF